ncbi:MAG: RHS repeat-associated core domain-containing protein [Microscillaceae bacterium]|nr:RHS repeat-associated core domain-containing protein [Microscillaceae bacterium]
MYAKGRIEIFVANEGNEDVWFDDLEITVDEALITQENHYYPFGMNIVSLEKQGDPNHKFQYNGKEKQEEFGLNWMDYGWRNYDAQLGRWHSIDNLTEKYPPLSPYNYVSNNPLIFVDPNGEELILNFKNWDALYTFLNTVNDVFRSEDRVQITLEKLENRKGLSFRANIIEEEGFKEENLKKGARNFYKAFKEVVDWPKEGTGGKDQVVEIDVVYGDKNVATGNYKNNTIDMADIMAWPKYRNRFDYQNNPTGAGKIIHEIREQFAKKIDGYKKGETGPLGKIQRHHENSGIDFENSINGNTRRYQDEMRPGYDGVFETFELKNGSVVQYQVLGGANSTKIPRITIRRYVKKKKD